LHPVVLLADPGPAPRRTPPYTPRDENLDAHHLLAVTELIRVRAISGLLRKSDALGWRRSAFDEVSAIMTLGKWRRNPDGMEPAPIQILSRAAFDLMLLSAGRHWVAASENRKPTRYLGLSSLETGLIWRSTTLRTVLTLQPQHTSKRRIDFRNDGLRPHIRIRRRQA
jgi:hypothetical protein